MGSTCVPARAVRLQRIEHKPNASVSRSQLAQGPDTMAGQNGRGGLPLSSGATVSAWQLVPVQAGRPDLKSADACRTWKLGGWIAASCFP